MFIFTGKIEGKLRRERFQNDGVTVTENLSVYWWMSHSTKPKIEGTEYLLKAYLYEVTILSSEGPTEEVKNKIV